MMASAAAAAAINFFLLMLLVFSLFVCLFVYLFVFRCQVIIVRVSVVFAPQNVTCFFPIRLC